MSYAVRTDGMGWRAVDSEQDVGLGEVFSQAAPTPPPGPLFDMVDGQWVFSTPRAIEQTRATARQIRLPIIGILDGMQSSALTAGDLPLAQAIEAAKAGLKDITKVDLSECANELEMQAAIVLAYQAIALALPTLAQTAFAQALA